VPAGTGRTGTQESLFVVPAPESPAWIVVAGL
jgi:hypothetical protein